MSNNESFGQMLRRLREGAGISLRSFSKMVDRTPTYISKIERGELLPPAEEVIREMARILRQDAEEMMALAGRIPADLPEIIREHPREMALMLRTARRLTPEQLGEITQSMTRMLPPTKGEP
jgi:hypothetical protein